MRTENGMETGMRNEIDELSRMTVGQLRQKYIEAFGEESRSNHKQFLFRRIAWRIQSLAEGGLSERARRRASRPGLEPGSATPTARPLFLNFLPHGIALGFWTAPRRRQNLAENGLALPPPSC